MVWAPYLLVWGPLIVSYGPWAPSSLLVLLLIITVMCVIAEKKLQLNIASLYVVVIFIIGGILIEGGPGTLGPPGYAYGRRSPFQKN